MAEFQVVLRQNLVILRIVGITELEAKQVRKSCYSNWQVQWIEKEEVWVYLLWHRISHF